MWQTRRRVIADLSSQDVFTEPVHPLQRSKSLAEEIWRKVATLGEYAVHLPPVSDSEAVAVQAWFQRLQEWSQFNKMRHLSTVEQSSLLNILECLLASLRNNFTLTQLHEITVRGHSTFHKMYAHPFHCTVAFAASMETWLHHCTHCEKCILLCQS